MTRFFLNFTPTSTSEWAAKPISENSKAGNLLFLSKVQEFNVPNFIIIDENTTETQIKLALPLIFKRDLVAVRSSPSRSLPGMLDTELWVDPTANGGGNVLNASKRIFASRDNTRAKAYMQAKGLVPGDLTVQVVIQRMVDATSGGSGVFYTHDSRGKLNPHGSFVLNKMGTSVVGNEEGLDCLTLESDTLPPQVFDFVHECAQKLDSSNRGPCEIEMAWERVKNKEQMRCCLLQVRTQKLDPVATVMYWLNRGDQKASHTALLSAKLERPSPMLPTGIPLLTGKGLTGNNYHGSRDSVYVTPNLYIADIERVVDKGYRAVIAASGTMGSHPVTVCASLGIPYLVMGKDSECFQPGFTMPEYIRIDGRRGEVYASDKEASEGSQSPSWISSLDEFVQAYGSGDAR